MVLWFVWYHSVFIQYSYYCDLFCLGPALCLRNLHCHVWVRYIDIKKTMVWCISLLLLSIDIRWLCYFILFYFKLTNGAMIKWWMVKWCNGEIKNRTGRFFSHKYRISSFVLFFKHNIFAADKAIHNFKIFITNNKYSNQVYIIVLRIKNKQTLIWYCYA